MAPRYDAFRPRETGEEFEATHVGKIRESKKLYEELMRCRAPGPIEKPYWKFSDAMRVIRDHAQPYPDATHPTVPLGRQILAIMRQKLNLSRDEEERLRFYTSAGKNSPLDVLHGVDAWIETDRPDESWTDFITLDLTLDPRKQELGYKADIIVGALPDPDDVPGYHEAVTPYAERVLQMLRDKQQQRSPRTHLWTGKPGSLGPTKR
ncbi:MAG: hypothetical protein Q7T01_01895 [bacterium]|nr:hypothetical protein [bacterium]